MTRNESGVELLRAAIGGSIDASTTIIGSYLQRLAYELGQLLGQTCEPDRLKLSMATAGREHPDSLAALLAWPPVAGVLLGRLNADDRVGLIVDCLDDVTDLPELGAAPIVGIDLQWLEVHAPPGQRASALLSPRALRSAMDLLHLSDGAAELVRLVTKIVTLRQLPDRTIIGSWSTDELIGCSILINIGPRTATTTVAATLLHEAIHHCQAMVEVQTPFIVEPDIVLNSKRYNSPWTGAPLTAKSFIAATFVWYGLALHWKRISERSKSEDAVMQYQAAVRGFIQSDPAAQIAEMSWALDRSVLPLVTRLQYEVRTSCG